MRNAKVWIGTFVIATLVTYLWHIVILASFYNSALADAAYMNAGKVAPLLPFLLLGDVVLTIIFVTVLDSKPKAMMKGALIGLLVGLHLSLVNHSLIPGWDASVIFADSAYGLVSGLLVGSYIEWLNKKSEQVAS